MWSQVRYANEIQRVEGDPYKALWCIVDQGKRTRGIADVCWLDSVLYFTVSSGLEVPLVDGDLHMVLEYRVN